MPASTFQDNLQAQFRSENIAGTIPNKQVDLATNCLKTQAIYTTDISCSMQWNSAHGDDPGYILFIVQTQRKNQLQWHPGETKPHPSHEPLVLHSKNPLNTRKHS